MAVLLLVRHAVTEATGKRLSGTTPGLHLSAEGKEQAARLADRLSEVRLAGVYASPLERCMETALAVAAGRDLEVAAVREVEEVGYGLWTGRPLSQLARTSLWAQVQQAPSSVRFPGGETLIEVQRRAIEALNAIAVRHRRGTAVVVTHADVIRLALAHYAGVHLDLFQRIIVSPASVSAVALGGRIPRILRMNDTGTLSDLADQRPAHPARSRSRLATPRTGPRARSSTPRGGS
jgi:probable phosphomutase (TIGR03848 family)